MRENGRKKISVCGLGHLELVANFFCVNNESSSATTISSVGNYDISSVKTKDFLDLAD